MHVKTQQTNIHVYKQLVSGLVNSSMLNISFPRVGSYFSVTFVHINCCGRSALLLNKHNRPRCEEGQ